MPHNEMYGKPDSDNQGYNHQFLGIVINSIFSVKPYEVFKLRKALYTVLLANQTRYSYHFVNIFLVVYARYIKTK